MKKNVSIVLLREIEIADAYIIRLHGEAASTFAAEPFGVAFVADGQRTIIPWHLIESVVESLPD